MRGIRTIVVIGAFVVATSGCTLYGFGRNDFGQLGDGTTKERLDPVAAARNPAWLVVDAGAAHGCGIDAGHALYCWGDNTEGALGLGTTGGIKTVPTRVGAEADWSDVSAASGTHSACGIRGGSLFCWGGGGNGQLGLGDADDRSAPTPVEPGTLWKQIDSSGDHTCGIHTDGALFCWGQGQLGDGRVDGSVTPVQVGTATDWKQVSAGFLHTCGIRGPGTLFCWGYNYSGQVGNGAWGPTQEPTTTPTPIVGPPNTGWTSVAAGGSHTSAIRASRALLLGQQRERAARQRYVHRSRRPERSWCCGAHAGAERNRLDRRRRREQRVVRHPRQRPSVLLGRRHRRQRHELRRQHPAASRVRRVGDDQHRRRVQARRPHPELNR